MSRGSSGTRARGGRTRPPEGSNQVPKKGKEHRSGSGEVDACARAFGKRPVCYLLWGLELDDQRGPEGAGWVVWQQQ